MGVSCAVLGPLAVTDGDRPVVLRGVLQRRLLGLLLSRANQVCPAEQLIDALWNGVPPPSAAKTLQSHVVRLRDLVDPDRQRLETRPPGYLWHADAASLDALRFEQLLQRGRRAGRAGVAESASAMLGDALALWRGPAYADLCDCEQLAREATRLEELRHDALEFRVDADLASGRGADLVPELEAAVAGQPYRETLWRQLAVALYRAGRQVDALEAVARVRDQLRGDLGVDPGPGLHEVEQAILRHDPTLQPTGSARIAAPLPPALTTDTWPIAGRQAELTWLQAAWSEAAHCRGGVVMVSGPAGIGRSRLLAELARRLAWTGVAVQYAAGRDGRDSLADALRLGGTPLPMPAEPEAVVTALREGAERVPTLVVLDDIHRCDGALGSLELAARTARDLPLLIAAGYDTEAASPALRALVQRLDPQAGRTWKLGPLPQEAVVQVVSRSARTCGTGRARPRPQPAGIPGICGWRWPGSWKRRRSGGSAMPPAGPRVPTAGWFRRARRSRPT